MTDNFKTDSVFVRHPSNEGVFVKHFFSKNDTDGCFNNAEVNIVPGFEIAPHVHDNASEYFYIVSGKGQVLIDSEWHDIEKGSVFKAPKGVTHSVKNSGREVLVMFCTFSPATR